MGSGRVGPATGDSAPESSVRRSGRPGPSAARRTRAARSRPPRSAAAAPPGRRGSRRRRRRRAPAARARRRRPRGRSPPASRPAASRGARPVSAPTKSLRETASRIGRPSACSAGSARSTSIVCAGVLAKSGPGSSISCSNATPRGQRQLDPLRQEARARRPRSARRGAGRAASASGGARVCISTSAGAGLGADVGQRRIAQPADVVDDRRAGGDRRPGHGRLVGVDRHARAELAAHPLDHAARPARSPPRARPAGGW